MKERRNISGMYFRVQNESTGKWENVCFEDMTDKQQDEILSKKEKPFIEGMVKALANRLNEVCEQFNIVCD